MIEITDPTTVEIFEYLDSWRPSRTTFHRSPATHRRTIEDRWALTPDQAREYMAAYVLYTVINEPELLKYI